MTRSAYLAVLAVVIHATALPAFGAAQSGSNEGIPYLSGGIGVAEQESILAREKDYNLKLVFTLVEGNYLADVAVSVTDSSGRTVMKHVADGPFFLARLSPGRYNVTATYEGKAVSREVDVRSGGLRTEYLRWPSNPRTDLPVSRWLER